MAQALVAESLMDSGLMSLRFAARYLGIFAEPKDVRVRRASHGIDPKENLIGTAKGLGLTIRRVTADWEKLKQTTLPALAALRDGSFLVVARFTDGKILIQHPTQGRPRLLGRAEFDSIWTGELILLKRRAKLGAAIGRWMVFVMRWHEWIATDDK